MEQKLLFRKQVVTSKRTGVFILIIGSIYFFAMVFRMVLGLTLYAEAFWFSNYLSTAFHYVLVLYLILVGWYHHKMSKPKSNNYILSSRYVYFNN